MPPSDIKEIELKFQAFWEVDVYSVKKWMSRGISNIEVNIMFDSRIYVMCLENRACQNWAAGNIEREAFIALI